MAHQHQPHLESFLDDVLHGRLDRRRIPRRAAGLGLALPALAALLRERAAAAAATAQPVPAPPDAPRVPRPFALPGGLGVDPYAWLENPDDPAVIAYLEAENAYTEAVMAPTKPLQEAIYQELVGRIKETDTSVLTPWDGYLYYSRTEEGKQYGIVCRKQGGPEAPEQILLDLNAVAGEYLALGGWLPSPDHRYLAYALDETGAVIYTIFIKDLQTGQVVEQLPSSTAFEWARDGSNALFYCRQDENHRPYALYRHALATDQAADVLLYEEPDPNFWLSTTTSSSRAFVFLSGGGFDTSEVRYLPADQPGAEPKLFAPRRRGVEYSLEHHGDDFLVLTNQDAVNFKLMAAPVADPAPANWREVVAHRDDVLLEGLQAFAGHLVLAGRERGFSQIWVRDLASGQTTPIPFDEAVYSAGIGANPEFETAKLRIGYSSLVTPPSTFEVDMATGERALLKQQEIVGGHDPHAYVSERLFATAPDGTQVPISLVRRRDAPAAPRALRLDAYGAYGNSTDPSFAVNRLALIDRGVTYAIAHVRGGQELGRRWYEAGKLLNKRNTFADFVACAEHLIAAGETAPDRLLALGGSAGGLLMGVAATERPDLFKAIVARVPAVDLPGLLLRGAIGPINREEFGDPRDPAVYAYQLSYSPYQNVAPQPYPNLLVTGGLNDDQVPYWIPAKWVAKLRDVASAPETESGANLLLLRTELGTGHQGVSGRYDALQETAFLYGFMLLSLGMTA